MTDVALHATRIGQGAKDNRRDGETSTSCPGDTAALIILARPSLHDSIAMPPKKRTRRTAEQCIADLQAEIEQIKSRAAAQKGRKDPTLRHISGAVRAIDKASSETKDKATRVALSEARATLSACLTLNGAAPVSGLGTVTEKSRGNGRPDADGVLDYVRPKDVRTVRPPDDEEGLPNGTLEAKAVTHRSRDSIAKWIALTGAGGVIGGIAYDLAKAWWAKSVASGQREAAEESLREGVFQALKQVKKKPHVSDHDLRLRAKLLTDDFLRSAED